MTLFGPGVVVLPLLGSLGEFGCVMRSTIALNDLSRHQNLHPSFICLKIDEIDALCIDCLNKKHLPVLRFRVWVQNLRRVSGIDGKESLEYSSHPQRASGGLMDRLDLELKSLV